MKTSHTILLDILPGQATTDAIAEHLTLPRPVIDAFLLDLDRDGLVSPVRIAHGLIAWQITEAGRALTNSLTTAAAHS